MQHGTCSQGPVSKVQGGSTSAAIAVIKICFAVSLLFSSLLYVHRDLKAEGTKFFSTEWKSFQYFILVMHINLGHRFSNCGADKPRCGTFIYFRWYAKKKKKWNI
jgi:hypothetical protein